MIFKSIIPVILILGKRDLVFTNRAKLFIVKLYLAVIFSADFRTELSKAITRWYGLMAFPENKPTIFLSLPYLPGCVCFLYLRPAVF